MITRHCAACPRPLRDLEELQMLIRAEHRETNRVPSELVFEVFGFCSASCEILTYEMERKRKLAMGVIDE